MRVYLRCTGRKVPSTLTHTLNRSGDTARKVWSVREAGEIVGYVSHSTHPVGNVERTKGFRGFNPVGAPTTPLATDRTATRNLASARRDWA